MDNQNNEQQKADQLRERVQQSILEIISKQVEGGEMTEQRATDIAKLVLEKLPKGIDYQRLIEVIPTLDDHFEELSRAVVPIMIEYEQKLKQAVEDKVKKLIENGQIDEALDLTNKAIEYQKKLA
ncbi:MAG: hypothetical protein QY330_02780 [Candidatus Dojkabacteria bacterium]|uniref:Uncharacterized protein n=1 Tax=Candidatus Dojkabacteria bacterium TaxID=2099670 RepID=A0A952AJ77_9BACT|nr:hypothetical protein [Candidatus Dojkabacteria bacterium]WKZ27447.1 MAG: hypothetical protein QY330_02780 [Candidatus Dojkabacteria bacterium]